MSTSRFTRPAQLAAGVLFAAALAACGGGSSESKARSSVRFTLGTDSRLASALAAATPANAPVAVVVSIETADGRLVHDLLRTEVYAFGSTYVSQQLELEVGEYRLTRFLVIDARSQTICAAPNAADPSADPALLALVRQPLPLAFDVGPSVTRSQPVEILPVGEHTPGQFGYAAFTFRVQARPESATRVRYRYGPDGALFSGDDEVLGYDLLEFDEEGDAITDRWFDLGPDGIWFTPDDVLLGWWWEHLRHQAGSNRRAPGIDGIPMTDDDPVTQWEQYDTRPASPTRLHELYGAAGADGAWFTADDVLAGYLVLDTNENGAELRRVRYSSPGLDGAWFTPDDEIGQDWFGAYVVSTYPEGHFRWGSWSRQVSYVDAGEDGTWFTPDDVVGSCLTHQFGDGTQYWTQELLMTPDDDGTCFTEDDDLVQYTVSTNVYE